MAEEKKIENAVYEYDVLEERTERRPAREPPYEREICSAHGGAVSASCDESVSGDRFRISECECFRDESTHEEGFSCAVYHRDERDADEAAAGISAEI